MSPKSPKPSTPRNKSNTTPPPSPPLSPAHSIAEAWRKESSDSKAMWRRINDNVRRRYNEARSGRSSKL
ncbi:hypothetical protein K435DRAFT_782813 [Dendrothele bispora CBS 962.96]|uniref:Uncharacterized protein n=1 Tax=Dendrothele bispora (strain CBS 962.96) TaxID=1314807 RepID=A0A4S8LDU0_DENBC|nr:hypothetical protein K435DRAFT_782813 [Dendrothele bispora CBS 962.96]